MAKVYSYVRFSSPEQLKGDSFRRQNEALEKYATEHNLELDTSLRMTDLGLSAFDKSNITKGALGEFLRAVETGQVQRGSHLLVESLDRLSRAQVTDALEQFIGLLNAGIVIATVQDNQVYSKESLGSNFSQLIVSVCIMQRANEESEMKSHRVGAAWDKKLQAVIDTGKLLTHKVPMWMQVLDGKITLIPERAEVVKRIFQMSKDGVGQNTIICMLNGDTPAWNKAGNWQTSYLQKILNNPAVYGAIEVKDTLVEDYYPPVITKDEFNYVRTIRAGRRTTPNSGTRKGAMVSNIFSGLLQCGYCKAKMQMSGYVETRYGFHKSRKYLICNGARTGATKCQCVQWDYNEFESLFLFKVSQLPLDKLFPSTEETRVPQLENKLIAISGQCDANESRIRNIYKAIEEDALPGLVKRLKELESEKTLLHADKAVIESQISSVRLSEQSRAGRMKLLLKLFKALAHPNNELDLRMIRETLYEQIKSITAKIEVWPTGPALNRAERDMRFMDVWFKSGQMVQVSEG